MTGQKVLLASAAALLALLAPAGTAGAEAPSAGAAPRTSPAPECVWKWKKQRIVKKVKRNGKVKRIVRYRKRRVCVPVPPPAPSRIGVNAFEFHFILSATSLLAGDTIAELNNRGEDPHDLHVARLDGTGAEIVVPETPPSTFARVRFETTPGTYRLWCSLPFHAERGMDATFEVTAPPG